MRLNSLDRLRTLRVLVLAFVIGVGGPCGCGDDEGDMEPTREDASHEHGHSEMESEDPTSHSADSIPSESEDGVASEGSAISTPPGRTPAESDSDAETGQASVDSEPSVSSVITSGIPVTSTAPPSSSSSELREAGPAEACDEVTSCPGGYRCVYLDPEHDLGVCSPECTSLGSLCGYYGPGTWAKCLFTLEDNTHACGFLCIRNHGDHVHHHTCPSGDWGRLRCERQSRIDGHTFCAPRQP